MMSCVVNRSGAHVGEAFDVGGEFWWILGLFQIFCWWHQSHTFCHFSHMVGVPMLGGPFGDHYNGFRFASVERKGIVKSERYSKIRCSIWVKRHELLELWGLIFKKCIYQFGDLCGRQKDLMFQECVQLIPRYFVMYTIPIVVMQFH